MTVEVGTGVIPAVVVMDVRQVDTVQASTVIIARRVRSVLVTPAIQRVVAPVRVVNIRVPLPAISVRLSRVGITVAPVRPVTILFRAVISVRRIDAVTRRVRPIISRRVAARVSSVRPIRSHHPVVCARRVEPVVMVQSQVEVVPIVLPVDM